MNMQWRVWVSGALLAAVIAAALYFPALRRQVNKAKDLTEKASDKASDAARKAGQAVKDAGQKIKDTGR